MNHLNENPQERESFFLRLYTLSFPDVASYIRKRGGSLEDARDVFQDALIIYYEKVVGEDFSLQKNEKAYLLGTTRYLWFKKYKADQRYQSFPEQEQTELLAEEEASAPAALALLPFLEKAGRKCMEVLRAFYYDQLSARELASTFGFSGSRSATVQKYKCLEKVRDQVKEKSLQYEDFLK